ncbi:MAG TPA: DUF115 domain-containing protein [Synergistaceae bacterium]|nr:DUF115 domain-containing protein [Synergistaceae bacterium]
MDQSPEIQTVPPSGERGSEGYAPQNREALAQRFPHIVQWLRSEERAEKTVEVRKSGANYWLVTPESRMVDAYDIDEGDAAHPAHGLWVVLGLGTGRALKALLGRPRPNLLKCFVFEDDPAVWDAALRATDLRDLFADERISFFGASEDFQGEIKRETGSLVHMGLWREAFYVFHKGEREARPEGVRETISQINKTLFLAFRALGNSAEDTLWGFYQMVGNLPAMRHSFDIGELGDRFAGWPAILVGAGPSLDKNFSLLHEVKDRAVLIATDAIFKKMLAEGVRPHVVACLEREEMNYTKYFQGIEEDVSDILFVPVTVCVPEMAGTWNGPLMLTHKLGLPLETWMSQISGLSQLRGGPSVSNVCYSVALALGCRTVALVGQDLAFGPERETHATGAGWDGQTIENFAQLSGKVRAVPGSVEDEVLTDDFFYLVKCTLEETIQFDKKNHEGIEIVDATEGGARIEGTTVMPLAEFLGTHVTPRDPFPEPPARLLHTCPLDDPGRRSGVREGFAALGESLELFHKILGDFEAAVDRVDVPVANDAQRRALAFEASRHVDRLMQLSPILTFIIQSHVVEMSGKTVRDRRLATPEEVRRWKTVHREFAQALRSTLERIEEIRSLALALLDRMEEDDAFLYEGRERPGGHLTDSRAREVAQRAVEKGDGILAFRLACAYGRFGAEWDPGLLVSLGRLLLASGRVRFARRVFQGIFEAPGREPWLQDATVANDLGVACVSYELGADRDLTNAHYYFSKAYALDPHSEVTEDNLIAFEQILQSSLAVTEGASPGHDFSRAQKTGESMARLELWEKALGWFEKALTYREVLETLSSDVRGKLLWERALCHEGLGRYAAAEAGYREAARESGDAPEGQWELLRYYLRRHRREEVLEALEALKGLPEGKAFLGFRTPLLRDFGTRHALPWLLDALERICSPQDPSGAQGSGGGCR